MTRKLPQDANELSHEIDRMLWFHVRTDIEIYDHITDETMHAIKIQDRERLIYNKLEEALKLLRSSVRFINMIPNTKLNDTDSYSLASKIDQFLKDDPGTTTRRT